MNSIVLKVSNKLPYDKGVLVEWDAGPITGKGEELFPDFITAAQFIRRLLEKIK